MGDRVELWNFGTGNCVSSSPFLDIRLWNYISRRADD